MSNFALKRNKKGFIYPALLVLVVFICVIYLTMQLLNKMGGFGEIPLGEVQLAVLNAQKESDKAMMFLEQAVRFAAVEAFDALIQKGAKPKCGGIKNNNLNYFLWNGKNRPQESCIPDAFSVYNDFFKTNLNRISAQKTYNFDPQTFNLFFGNNKIAGFSYKQLEIPITPKEKSGFDAWTAKAKEIWGVENSIGIYYTKPSFEIEFSDLFEFLDTKKLIENILMDCSLKTTPAEFNACIKEQSNKVENQLNTKGIATKVVTNLEDAVFFDITFKKTSLYQKEQPVLRIALAKHTVETVPSANSIA